MEPLLPPSPLKLTPHEAAVARQWAILSTAKQAADTSWKRVRVESRRLARLAKLGRRKSVIVRVSETAAVKIENQWKGEDECFAPAFAKKLKVLQVKWEGGE